MKSKLTYLKKIELFKELDFQCEGQFFAVADQSVKNHLPQWVQYSSNVFWLKNPEEEKTIETFGKGGEFFIRQGMKKDCHLYAFGGGATADLAGFIASSLFGGIKWSMIPTTLFAMAEGAIGGIVRINTAYGKNLIGTKHLPEKVYICGEFLNTLTDKDLISGKGELLKFGLLSREINSLILNKRPLEEIAFECAKLKLNILENGRREQEELDSLNIGSTLGFVFQQTLNLPQGYAMALGLKYLFKVMHQGEALNQMEKMVTALSIIEERLELTHFKSFEFSTFIKNFDQLYAKRDRSLISVILMKGVASQYIEEISYKELRGMLEIYEEFKKTA